MDNRRKWSTSCWRYPPSSGRRTFIFNGYAGGLYLCYSMHADDWKKLQTLASEYTLGQTADGGEYIVESHLRALRLISRILQQITITYLSFGISSQKISAFSTLIFETKLYMPLTTKLAKHLVSVSLRYLAVHHAADEVCDEIGPRFQRRKPWCKLFVGPVTESWLDFLSVSTFQT